MPAKSRYKAIGVAQHNVASGDHKHSGTMRLGGSICQSVFDKSVKMVNGHDAPYRPKLLFVVSWSVGSRLRWLVCKISATGSHLQVFITWRVCNHLYGAITAVTARVVGL